MTITNILELAKVGSQFLHPLFMWILFGATVYVLYLGFQVTRSRSADQETRKTLRKGKFKLKHHQFGSILLTLMIVGNISGMGITYLNNGHLFVDAHLLVGLGMTALIAAAASLVPFMQQGKSWARYTHISLTLGLVALFGWEAVTGMEILNRIVEAL